MKKEQMVLNEMISDFAHWARYNPTLLKEKFGIQDTRELVMIFERIRRKLNR
jgi:hypothetical protein